MRGTFPSAYYWLVSVYHPLKCRAFLRRHPKRVTGGPRIALVRGEAGPDKLWSYSSVYAVYRALRPHYDVDLIVRAWFGERDVAAVAARRPALVSLGDDRGVFQALFERRGIPVLGSDSAVCRLCYDKLGAKELAARHGIPSAPWRTIRRGESPGAALSALSFPVVVKPRWGGSSVGVARAATRPEFDRALRRALHYAPEALVESYIRGEEYTCTVYGNDAPRTLPVYRRIMPFERQEFAARGEPLARTRYPVVSGAPFLAEIADLSRRAYAAFGCRDMIRVDWKYDTAAGRLYFLEINILPWLENPGYIGEGAELVGSSYEEFVVSLFRDSLARPRAPV